MQVIFTPLAERNIDSLHEYITTHSSASRAAEFIVRIVAFCNSLATFPRGGSVATIFCQGCGLSGSNDA